MPKGNDRKHFEDYRKQTQVKHNILAAYLPAYYNILKRSNPNLVYIDGFAGPGTYVQEKTGIAYPGSPLLALQLIADSQDFSKQVSTIFIESDDILFSQLTDKVDKFFADHPAIRKPICRLGTFAETVEGIISNLKGRLAPTFLFVDPCGVDGTSFNTIRRVMKNDKCEAFVFFNIDGIRRIAGLKSLSTVLVELMGSEERAEVLYNRLRTTSSPTEREEIILSEYCKALKEELGTRYVIPFRVEHEDQQKASHYLIHATRHPLGFRIMKDVMWQHGHGEDEAGGLELRQRSRTNFIPMFDVQADTKQEILEALKDGPCLVSTFYEDWTVRPENRQCVASYRRALLELEADGKIEILSKDGKTVTAVERRPRRMGKATLGKDYYVRLRK